MTVFSWIGWLLGAKFNITAAFIASFIGSIVGVYIGWKINQEFFE